MGEYYDAAVSGADPHQRPGFAEMLQRLAADGAKTIIVEAPDRFARDLAVQLAGHDMLKALGSGCMSSGVKADIVISVCQSRQCRHFV